MTAQVPTLILEAGRADKQYWRDLWNYRELFLILAWRDISVRYKQTLFGVTWAVLRPLLTMVVFTIIFSKVAKLPTEGDAPYALLVFAGMLPWYLFSSALAGCADSLVTNSNLISKVYFPRLIIPLAAIVTALLDFLISFAILLGLMLWYQYPPTWGLLTLPLFVLMGVLASIGPGIYISSLNVKYRDFRYVIPFILQFGLYISPVGFSSSAVPDAWRLAYSINPVVGIIDGFRWAILGGESALYWPGFYISLGVIAVLLWLGVHQFKTTEKSFADII